jgi:hypothetical protein
MAYNLFNFGNECGSEWERERVMRKRINKFICEIKLNLYNEVMCAYITQFNRDWICVHITIFFPRSNFPHMNTIRRKKERWKKENFSSPTYSHTWCLLLYINIHFFFGIFHSFNKMNVHLTRTTMLLCGSWKRFFNLFYKFSFYFACGRMVAASMKWNKIQLRY